MRLQIFLTIGLIWKCQSYSKLSTVLNQNRLADRLADTSMNGKLGGDVSFTFRRTHLVQPTHSIRPEMSCSAVRNYKWSPHTAIIPKKTMDWNALASYIGATALQLTLLISFLFMTQTYIIENLPTLIHQIMKTPLGPLITISSSSLHAILISCGKGLFEIFNLLFKPLFCSISSPLTTCFTTATTILNSEALHNALSPTISKIFNVASYDAFKNFLFPVSPILNFLSTAQASPAWAIKSRVAGNVAASTEAHAWATNFVGAVTFFLALKSRIFSPLDNSRPSSTSRDPIFQDRIRPWWQPPQYAFPLIWISIAFLRSISSVLVFQQTYSLLQPAIYMMMLHLSIGDTWNTINNREKRLGTACIGVVFVLLSALKTTHLYWLVSPTAGKILAPSCVWLTIATALVFSIFRLNYLKFNKPSLFPSVEEGPPSKWVLPVAKSFQI